MAVVGRFVGGAGLAAVSSASRINYLITSLGFGITIGGALVAQYKGARDEAGMREAAGALRFVSMVVAALLTANALLDLILVGPLRMSTRGAALATVASQGLAFGVAVAAAASIGLGVNTFAAMPCWAIGQAITTMAGQNMGSGDVERAAKTARTGALLGAAANALAVILVQAFTGPIVVLFAGDPAIVECGILYLRICCSLNCLAYAVMYELDCFATGVGDSLFALSNTLMQSVVMRLLLSWLLAFGLGHGFKGLFWAEMLCPLPSFIAGTIYFRIGRWKRRRLIG